MSATRIGVDVGGTFTDVILHEASDGDPIVLDVEARRLDLDVPEAEVRRRLDELGPPTPVRISLTHLEREGLVEVGPTGRATVTRASREDFEEIYAARAGLEGLAARVGAVALTDGAVSYTHLTLPTKA